MNRLPRNWPTSADEIWQVPTADHWSIAVHVYGDPRDDRPAVALFHGALANSRSFDIDGFGLAPYLRARGVNAFAVDFRGRGHSLKPTWAKGWTIDDLIRLDVPAVIKTIQRRAKVDRVHVVGHSMGGMAILGHLALGGDGVDRVVTLAAATTFNIPPYLGRVVRALKHFDTIPIARLGERAGFMAAWIPMPLWKWCANPDNLDPGVFHKFLTCGSGDISVRKFEHLERICNAGRLVSADGRVDYTASMASITHSIRLYGAAADSMIPRQSIERTRDLLCNADVELHWLGRETGLEYDYGHLDVVIGRNVAADVFRSIHGFLAHDDSRREAG